MFVDSNMGLAHRLSVTQNVHILMWTLLFTLASLLYIWQQYQLTLLRQSIRQDQEAIERIQFSIHDLGTKLRCNQNSN